MSRSLSRSVCAALRVLPVLVLSLGALFCAAAQDAVEARVSSVSGRVLVAGAGNSSSVLTPGVALSPGDRIDTRGGGRLVISLSDGSMVIVQPESVVVIKNFRAAESLRELFEITLGRVRVKINHFAGRPNPYRMNSPTASIAVRGTEFSVSVDAGGDTQVAVFEGSVEVSSLDEPNRKTVLGPGNGVLVRPGQDFRFFTPLLGRDFGEANEGPGMDRDRRPGGVRADVARPETGRPDAAGSRPDAARSDPSRGDAGQHAFGDHDDDSPRNVAGTYARYIASLSQVGQIPFLMRFNAFPDAHLDSLENPAYAGEFRTAEGRLFLLPTVSGRNGLDDVEGPLNYSFSPQLSMFSPVVGSRFTIGGSVAASTSSNASSLLMTDFNPILPGQAGSSGSLESGSSTSRFLNGSFLVSRRFGADERTSFGLGLDRLVGNGSLLNQSPGIQTDASRIDQTRLTFGWSRELKNDHKLGVFYRYGLISANDSAQQAAGADATASSGHSSEFGLRLRGPLSRRLYYGVQASWLGLSLSDNLKRALTVDTHQRDRASRGALGVGFGYILRPQTVISLDLSGGVSRTRVWRSEDGTGDLLQQGRFAGHFLSLHVAVQSDVWRRFFVNASLLLIHQGDDLATALFADRNGLVLPPSASLLAYSTPYRSPSRFSDFGAGWRFTPRLSAQYVLTTDYGFSGISHTLMLRYTFHLRGE